MNNNPNTGYIALLGAYERDNFGDLLFYRVTENLLRPWPVVSLSFISADMNKEGLGNVVSASAWFDVCGSFLPNCIVSVGGEIFGCTPVDALKMDLEGKVSEEYSSLSADLKLDLSSNVSWKQDTLAYVYCNDFLKENNIKVGINSVGGKLGVADSRRRSEVTGLLRELDWVSVRDNRSFAQVSELIEKEPKLYPDIVSCISSVCNSEVCDAAVEVFKNFLIKRKKYFVFQANAKFYQDNPISEIAEELFRVAVEFNLSLVLQPAGTASYHDSFDDCHSLRAALLALGADKEKVIIQFSRNIWQQVALIANSKCFIGTSLHGRIVAISYGVPRVSLVNEKVSTYAETWEDGIQPYGVSVHNIRDSFVDATSVSEGELYSFAVRMIDESKAGFSELREKLGIGVFSGNYDDVCHNIDVLKFKSVLKECKEYRDSMVTYVKNIDALVVENKKLDFELGSLKHSSYWKIMYPFRASVKMVKKYLL